jgi:1,2-diacylglycerol-3-alpha-glucose alpha-1,2-galactosyltransferase
VKKIRVNVIYRPIANKGHGVYTAFRETVDGLSSFKSADVSINQKSGDFDITHVHALDFFGLSRLRSNDGSKKIVSAHLVPDSFVGSIKFAKVWKPFAYAYLKYCYQKADAVIAVSDSVKKYLLKTMKITKPVFILPNYVDEKIFKSSKSKKVLRKELKIEDKFTIVCTGQLQPRKRYDIFVEIAKNNPNWQMIWIGGVNFEKLGAKNRKIQQQITSPPKNLLITGVLKRDKVAKYLQAADLFFFPSEQETFGTAIVEAAAAGLPIVLRDITDYKNTFKNFVATGDDSDFQKILQKAQEDGVFREDLIKKSKEIIKKYNTKTVTKQLVDIYEEVLLF